MSDECPMLPRAKTGRLGTGGWTIDPKVLMEVSAEVHRQGWDTCLEVVEIAMLEAEKRLNTMEPDGGQP